MPAPVYLPKFDPQHEESQIIQWFVAEGAAVRENDPICEVETDKVNMEVEAPADGTLAALYYAAGEVAPAATVIAYVLLEGEGEADLPAAPAKSDTASKSETPAPTQALAAESLAQPRVSPVARRVAAAQNIDLDAVAGSGPGGRIVRRDVETQAIPAANGKVRATPAARRLAREQGLDLGDLNGSGPKGRVQASDVRVNVGQAEAVQTEDGAERFPLAGMRARIAQRVQQSYQTAPHIFVEMPVDMSQIEAQRQAMKAEGASLSMTAVLVMACAWALKRHPKLNATLQDDVVTLHQSRNIGVAVALDEGLIVPVVHDAGQLSLAQIQQRSSDLIARARDGQLQPGEVAGGTFTISNLGMFGVTRFTAIINPPQVAILAVGGIRRQFVPDEYDQPVLRPIMTLVLSVDHRVIDGADAARFLDDLRGALEQPLRLLW